MGVVLRAHDPTLDRIVAVKVMRAEYASNPTARKRFLREAHAAAAIAHLQYPTSAPLPEVLREVGRIANPSYDLPAAADGVARPERSDGRRISKRGSSTVLIDLRRTSTEFVLPA